MNGQIAPAPYAPQNPQQSQMLAQVLQQMQSQPKITTPQALGANLVASGLNTFGQQARGQAGANQWHDPTTGAPSGNWMNSPLGQKLGGMFSLGQAANPQGQIGYSAGPQGMLPQGMDAGMIPQ